MKTLRNDRIRKSSKLSSSKESTTTSHSSKTKWQNNDGKHATSLAKRISHQNGLRETIKKVASLTTQHHRSRRDIDAISESKRSLPVCANFTFPIKYEDEYKVWNNFSTMYKGRMYYHNEYRVTDYGLQVCISSDPLVQIRWWEFIAWEKEMMASKHCNDSVDGFYHENYTLFKNMTVFFKPTGQTFTRQDYGVIFGHFAICSAKLSLSCNDDLIKAKYSEQYHVFNNFSLFYNNTTYDYREYRFKNDSLEMCASKDSRVQAIWRTRNSWEKFKDVYKCRGAYYYFLYYAVSKQFTVYSAHNGQHVIRHDYAVIDGKPNICKEKIRPKSTDYTQDDLLMCNDSIININYNDEYKVWNNFSILYKNKMYDYTEYRVLNDGVKICNSTDNDVRNIWKLRNYWLKATMHLKSCKESTRTGWFYRQHYTVSKQFTVYYAGTGQYFTRNDYGVIDGKPYICEEKSRPDSTEYTKEDLLMCNDSIININYNDEYKVWTNFSILYKNKVYDYTEYRVLNDGVKICNSTDNHVRNIWKLRNYWVKGTRHYESCRKPILEIKIHQEKYAVLKDFRILIFEPKQIISKYDYGVFEGRLIICIEKLLYLIKEIYIAFLCALVLSLISSLLLLIVYCMLPELRTLPGLNLMSLGFAFLLCLIYVVVMFALRLHTGKLFAFSCNLRVVIFNFILYSILTNAAVSVYHLKKTFCGNTLVKSDESKWKRFLKYSLFSWGVPVIITIVHGVLVGVGVLRYHVIAGLCVYGHTIPDWLAVVKYHGLPGCLMLFIIVMFIFTAYQIRKKLKASSSIAQKSNIVKNRNNFVMLLKLSTVTAISFFPVNFTSYLISLNHYIGITFEIVAFLSGFYIGIAFVFTKKNYRLLKKKYFPVKKTPVNAT